MIAMGIMMVTGWMNQVSGFFSSLGSIGTGKPTLEETVEKTEATASDSGENGGTISDHISESEAENTLKAPDFAYADQFGTTHSLSEYRGKVVFLNFWATWCGYCVDEMGDIQALYEEYGENTGDVIILGAASPATAQNRYTQEQSEEKVTQFLEENGYTYPVLMDRDGQLFWNYGITSLPTTVMIDPNGNVSLWIPGALSKEKMIQVIEGTKREAEER